MVSLSGNEMLLELRAMRAKASADGNQMLLTRSALARLLDRHTAGELTTDELVGLANELEANDEVDYEPEAEEVVASVLFELASPEINGALTADKVRCLREHLA